MIQRALNYRQPSVQYEEEEERSGIPQYRFRQMIVIKIVCDWRILIKFSILSFDVFVIQMTNCLKWKWQKCSGNKIYIYNCVLNIGSVSCWVIACHYGKIHAWAKINHIIYFICKMLFNAKLEFCVACGVPNGKL